MFRDWRRCCTGPGGRGPAGPCERSRLVRAIPRGRDRPYEKLIIQGRGPGRRLMAFRCAVARLSVAAATSGTEAWWAFTPTQVELGRPSPIDIEPFCRLVSSYMMLLMMNVATLSVSKCLLW